LFQFPEILFMLIKIVVIIMLVLIFASLFSALVFLYRDKGRGTRTARALTWRIGLSITLFLMLMAGFYFGIIPPQGLSVLR
jgi:cytochrome bd-type quinol oxidase subunit 2